MREIKSVVYETLDGKIFKNKEDAEKHEQKLKGIKAYKIYAYPDLTEGRHGYQFQGYLLVNARNSHSLFVENWCYSKYGNRVDFIMGGFNSNAIMEKWSFVGCDLYLVNEAEILDKIEEDLVDKIWGK